jgi:hypothetical protein
MRHCLALLIALSLASPLWAADWDARTRRTNTNVQDADIQMALSQGLPPQFGQSFPIQRFGIYVLIDRSHVAEAGRDIVYISLGLSKRRPDGSYELPTATYSTQLLLSQADPGHERQAVIQRLVDQSREFSRLMVENASRIH